MLAILGAVLYAIGIILKLVDKHPDWIIWLVLVAGLLVAVDVAWFARRSGWYGRRAA
jgi:hypothetical protein